MMMLIIWLFAICYLLFAIWYFVSVQGKVILNNRRSLVTGGGGFIGAHLVSQLLEQGETVRVLELHDVPLPSSVEVVRGSVCDASVVRDALDDVQRLYHLAGNPNLWAVDKKDFQRVNYEGTCTVFKEAARKGLEVVVHTSTESILTGSAQINAPVDSDVRRVLKEMPGPYCRSKFLAEQAAFQAGSGITSGTMLTAIASMILVLAFGRILLKAFQMAICRDWEWQNILLQWASLVWILFNTKSLIQKAIEILQWFLLK